MDDAFAEDLARTERLAFARVAGREELVRRFHAVTVKQRRHPDWVLLARIYEWMFVPWSLWPVDLRGLGLQVLAAVETGKELDAEARLMVELLPDAPADAVREIVSEYEHGVKEGSYETLIEAQHKFDLIEKELAENQELKADWERIKQQFDVDAHRNSQGVIRRRFAQERNFRPADWKFAWETEKQRFQNVFDAFCHKWDLYGIQSLKSKVSGLKSGKGAGETPALPVDKPLLLKLTVNVTPFGTMIMVPRYWSFDPRRDLKWKEIMRLHRARCGQKQGVKLSSNEAERRAEKERAAEFWEEATAAGLKGERRTQWVMGKLGWDARTDESRLRRMLKKKAKG